VGTIEELLGRKSSGSGLESREYGRRGLSCCPRGTCYPQKLAPTSPTSGGRSVGIVRSRTQATEFSFLVYLNTWPGDLLRWPRDTLYQQKLALASLTSCGRSVGIVRSRTLATEFFFSLSQHMARNSTRNLSSTKQNVTSGTKRTSLTRWKHRASLTGSKTRTALMEYSSC
jgi:hypothetical protein